MKKIVFVSVMLLISSVLFASALKEEMEATYVGVAKSGALIFEDQDGVLYYFKGINTEVDFESEDTELIGSLYSISYEYYYEPAYDEEGEDTGESEEFLRILSLKLL